MAAKLVNKKEYFSNLSACKIWLIRKGVEHNIDGIVQGFV